MNKRPNGSLAFAALALAFAILLTSCGAVGDYALRQYLEAGERVARAAGESEAETAAVGSEASTAGAESALSAESADTQDGGEEENGIRPPDAAGEVSTPLMWHAVDKKTGGELYLLGSMHAGLDDMCLFPDEVYAAFDECRALAVECDVIEFEKDVSAGIEGMRMLVYTDGTGIADHIDRATYEAAAKIMEENGFSRSSMDFYVPILWQQVIDEILTENTPYKYKNGVDRYFISEAKRLGKRIFEIEDPLDTYRAMAALSVRTQTVLLEDEVDPEYIASFGDEIASLYEMWKRGDEDEIEKALLGNEAEAAGEATDATEADSTETTGAASNEATEAEDLAPNGGENALSESDAETNAVEPTGDEAAAESSARTEAVGTVDTDAERAACYEEYNDMMIGDRNVGMIAKAREYLRRGIKTFYVVGLAHMVGDDGIIEGLKDLGVTVERVEYGAD